MVSYLIVCELKIYRKTVCNDIPSPFSVLRIKYCVYFYEQKYYVFCYWCVEFMMFSTKFDLHSQPTAEELSPDSRM